MEKIDVLKQFLLEFLPPQKHKRKYLGNELSYLQTTLDGVFKKHWGRPLTYQEIVKGFDAAGYQQFEMYHHYDPDTKVARMTTQEKGVPTKQGVLSSKGNEFYNNYICFNVSAKEVRAIYKTLKRLPPNTGENKLKERQELLQRIEAFFEPFKN